MGQAPRALLCPHAGIRRLDSYPALQFYVLSFGYLLVEGVRSGDFSRTRRASAKRAATRSLRDGIRHRVSRRGVTYSDESRLVRLNMEHTAPCRRADHPDG